MLQSYIKMIGKLFLVIVGILLIVVSVTYAQINNGGIKIGDEEKVFQGPVPEGYDQEHFWKTGETKLLELIDG